MTKNQPFVHGVQTTFHDDPMTDKLGFVKRQIIPQSFLSTLLHEKIDSVATPSGNFHRVASIPVSVVEDLLQNHNFDVMKEDARATLKMLRKLHLDGFITTNKRV